MSTIDKLLELHQTMNERLERLENRDSARDQKEEKRDECLSRMESALDDIRVIVIDLAATASENRSRLIEQDSRLGERVKHLSQFSQQIDSRVTKLERTTKNGITP